MMHDMLYTEPQLSTDVPITPSHVVKLWLPLAIQIMYRIPNLMMMRTMTQRIHIPNFKANDDNNNEPFHVPNPKPDNDDNNDWIHKIDHGDTTDGNNSTGNNSMTTATATQSDDIDQVFSVPCEILTDGSIPKPKLFSRV